LPGAEGDDKRRHAEARDDKSSGEAEGDADQEHDQDREHRRDGESEEA
jgi:hypothetical protein